MNRHQNIALSNNSPEEELLEMTLKEGEYTRLTPKKGTIPHYEDVIEMRIILGETPVNSQPTKP